PKCERQDQLGHVVRIACGPKEFEGNQCLLFRNNANGKFTNVSKTCCGRDKDGNPVGLEPRSKGLGVLILDLNDDGKMDIFVANDEILNEYYVGLGGGQLKSDAHFAGLAAGGRGNPMGSMGVEAGDLCGNGRVDVFITNFFNEGDALFRNEGKL